MTRKAKVKEKKETRKQRNILEKEESHVLTFGIYNGGEQKQFQLSLFWPPSDIKKAKEIGLNLNDHIRFCDDHLYSDLDERFEIIDLEKALYISTISIIDSLPLGRQKKLEPIRLDAQAGLEDISGITRRINYLKKRRAEKQKTVDFWEKRFPPRPDFQLLKIVHEENNFHLETEPVLPKMEITYRVKQYKAYYFQNYFILNAPFNGPFHRTLGQLLREENPKNRNIERPYLMPRENIQEHYFKLMPHFLTGLIRYGALYFEPAKLLYVHPHTRRGKKCPQVDLEDFLENLNLFDN